MLALADRRRRRNFPEPRNGAHRYMRALRGRDTNTLFIAYTIKHGTVDPTTPGVYNNPSTAVFTFNGTSIADHFTEYFHFQKANIPNVDPIVIRRVTRWIIEDFVANRGLLPNYIVVLRDLVPDGMEPMIEEHEFDAFKEGIKEYINREQINHWIPQYAFGMAPWRAENTEPLVFLFQNDDRIFETLEEFQLLIVSMFIPIRILPYRYSVMEPLWALEHAANLWTKIFPTYAAFRAANNDPFPRIGNSSQYDFDRISLQFQSEI